jgi:hypothetical protein
MVITIVLAGLVVARPALTVARGGKVLAFLAFFIFPVFAGLLGMENHMERSKQTSFCLTCHIMQRIFRTGVCRAIKPAIPATPITPSSARSALN